MMRRIPQSISWASLEILSQPSALQSMFLREVEPLTLNYKDYSRPLLNFFRGFKRIFLDISQPTCGPFRYFMVLVDASTRWSHVYLLSTRNAAFTKLLAQIIKLRAHHPDHLIKSIRLDNAGEFMSQTFDDYCMSVGIAVEHLVPHVHTQNGLVGAFIKRLQTIAWTLVMRTNLLVYA